MTRGLKGLALTISLRHLLAHWRTHLLAAGGIAVGVATIVAVGLTTSSAVQSFQTAITDISGRASLFIQSRAGDVLDERQFDRLKPLWPFARLHPVLEATALLARPGTPANTGEAVTLLGLDLIAMESWPGRQEAAAPLPDTKERFRWLRPGSLVVSQAVLKRLHVLENQTVDVVVGDQRLPFTVVMGVPTAAAIAVQDLAAFQQAWHRERQLTRIEVEPRPWVSEAEISRQVQAFLPSDLVAETPAARGNTVDRMLAAYRFNLGALAFVALIVGGFFIHDTVAVAAARRHAEIGLLRAVGATRFQIAALFLGEALATAALAWLPGLVGGTLLARGALDTVSRTVNSLYMPTKIELATLSPFLVLISLAAALLVTIFAAASPTLEASQVEPICAIRLPSGPQDTGRPRRQALHGVVFLALALALSFLPAFHGLPVCGYAAAASVIAGCAMLLPIVMSTVGLAGKRLGGRIPSPAWIASGILSANAGRAAVTAASLLSAVAMVSSLDLMITAFRRSVVEWVDQTLTGDLFLRPRAAGTSGFRGNLAADLVRTVARLPGIQDSNPVSTIQVNLFGAPARLTIQDLDVVARRSRLVMVDGSPDGPTVARAAAGEGVLVSESLAFRAHLKAGDRLAVPLPGRVLTVPILAVYRDYTYDGGVVRMDRKMLGAAAGHLPVATLILYLDPKATGVEQAITRAVAGREVAIVHALDLHREIEKIFDDTFAVTIALRSVATVVALLGIMGSLVLFSQSEAVTFALLRFVGAATSQVQAALLWLGVILGVVGTVAGLLTGRLLSLLLIHVINRQSFGWTLTAPPDWTGVLALTITVPLAALLAALMPARRLARLDPTRVLRGE